MSPRPVIVAGALLLLFAGTHPCRASWAALSQPGPLPPMSLMSDGDDANNSASEPADTHASLRSRIGAGWAEHQLGSEDPEERLAALARLGEAGTPRALDALASVFDPSGAPRSPAERLAAVRAMARYAGNGSVRRVLILVMSGAGSTESPVSEQERLVRESAAMALAASGQHEAWRWLGRSLRQTGPLADAAVAALVAHPPPELDPLLHAPGPPTVPLAIALERLGDQRAFAALRRLVITSSAEVQARAALALTRLGNLETVELARHWAHRENSVAHREAAARILAVTRSSGFQSAVQDLLDDPRTRTSGLELAIGAADPKLVPALIRCLDQATTPDEAHLALVAMARAGGSEAFRQLERTLGSGTLGSAAAYALALSPHPQATDLLARALTRAKTQAVGARASVVRQAALAEEVPGLRGSLGKLLRSPVAANRAAGAWGLAVTEPRRLTQLLRSTDPVVVEAAARALPNADHEGQKVAAERLCREREHRLRQALALVLVHDGASDLVPTSTLAELVESEGPAAPLAAYRLMSRSGARVDQYEQLLLDSPDPLWRTHAALGLGLRQTPRVVSKLERSYAMEFDASVRHALVVALGLHTRRSPWETLRHAQSLDPDPATRQAARLATLGLLPRNAGRLELGHTSVWLTVRAPGMRGGDALPQAVVITARGLALPVTPDPDGVIVLVGLAAGPVGFRVWPPTLGPSPGQNAR